jgi:hypothetical protein
MAEIFKKVESEGCNFLTFHRQIIFFSTVKGGYSRRLKTLFFNSEKMFWIRNRSLNGDPKFQMDALKN